MYSFCAMYSLRMSFWMVPEIFFQSAPCFSATTRYIAHNTDAGELTHGPQLAAISAGVNAAGVGRLSGVAEIFFVIPVLGKIGSGIEPAHRISGNGGEARVALIIQIDAAGGCDGLFRRSFQRWS